MEPWGMLAIATIAGRVEAVPAHPASQSCGFKRPLFKDRADVGALPLLDRVVDTAANWAHHIGIPVPFDSETPKGGAGFLECLAPFLMNCSDWRTLSRLQPCSSSCPFVAHLKPFACTFTCVAATQCHVADKRATFANPKTWLCEDSRVEGCRVSHGQGTCVECRKHFRLEGNGTLCTYGQESTFLFLAEHVGKLTPVFILILVLAVAALCWQLRKRAAGQWELLALARKHHHLCKIRRSPKVYSGAPLYSLFENVHKNFLIGVGLPLYYNSLVFLFLLSLVLLSATSLAFLSGDTAVFAYNSEPTDSSMCSWATTGISGTGVHEMYEKYYDFMGRMSAATLLLFFLALALILVHAKHQLQHAEWFDQQHSSLRDVALHVEGLPAQATDEAVLIESLSDQLDVQVQAISVAYDFSSVVTEVQALIDRHLAYAEVHLRGCGPGGVRISPLPESGAASAADAEACNAEALEACCSQDAKVVREWFAPDSGKLLGGTGHAFVVFEDKQLRDRAFATTQASEHLHWVWRDTSTGAAHKLRVHLPACEPTNINWRNLGLSRCKGWALFAAGWLTFLLTFCALAVCIFWPYAVFVTSYLREAGIMPRGLVMSTLGSLVGVSGWLMCVTIGSRVGKMGLHTVEDEMVVVFVAFTHFCVGMSAFNVYLTWFYTQNMWDDPGSSWKKHFQGRFIEGPVLTLRDLMQEIDLGSRVLQLLVPGMLFTPCLVSPLQNFLVPYLQGSLLLLLGRKKSRREAERYLEPLAIGLAWDYQAHVTLPACCCLTLFILSSSMCMSYVYLSVWCACFYVFQRLIHLRVCKKMYVTTNKLDCVVLYLGWGLLLAELAACHAYWRARRLEWPWFSVLIAILASYVLYWAALWWGIGLKPFLSTARVSSSSSGSSPKPPEVCYNWLNVNPVYVLKSQYCADLLGEVEQVVFYDPGKEYLQLSSESVTDCELTSWKQQPGSRHWAKADWGLSVELEGLGLSTPWVSGANGAAATGEVAVLASKGRADSGAGALGPGGQERNCALKPGPPASETGGTAPEAGMPPSLVETETEMEGETDTRLARQEHPEEGELRRKEDCTVAEL